MRCASVERALLLRHESLQKLQLFAHVFEARLVLVQFAAQRALAELRLLLPPLCFEEPRAKQHVLSLSLCALSLRALSLRSLSLCSLPLSFALKEHVLSLSLCSLSLRSLSLSLALKQELPFLCGKTLFFIFLLRRRRNPPRTLGVKDGLDTRSFAGALFVFVAGVAVWAGMLLGP
jgi:hypothetical protein